MLIKKRRGEYTMAHFPRPALSLEGERSDTQAGLLAYNHRLPLLPGFLTSGLLGSAPAYSDGIAPDFHRFPYSPFAGT